MADTLEKLYGRVVAMSRQTHGSILTAASSIADTVLAVASSDDFDVENGGQVVIDGAVYEYVEVDEDSLTITLDTGLLAAADEDTFVELYDPEVNGVVVEYVADVLLDDQDPGDEPIEVTVQHGLVNMLAESVRGGAAEAVVLIRDGEDDWVIWQIDGKLAVDVALEEAKDEIDQSLQDIYDLADSKATEAYVNATAATISQAAANGKSKVTYSASAPGSTANNAGDIWFQKDVPTQTIIGQWEGLGGTSWSAKTLRNEVIANLDAGKLTAGSAFTNALWVKTNLTLGDAFTNGVIQSHNFAGSPVGVFIDKNGLVAKGGTIAGANITGTTITGSTLTAGSGSTTVEVLGNASGTGIPGIRWTSGSRTIGMWVGPSGDMLLVHNNSGREIRVASDYIALSGNVTSGPISATGEVHATASFFDDSLVGGGGTGANINDNGKIIRTPPSSRKFKTDIVPLDVDPAAVLSLEGVTFRYKDTEEHGDGQQVGLIAEDLDAAGFGEFVTRDRKGEVTGILYDRLIVTVLPVLRDLTARVEALEAAD